MNLVLTYHRLCEESCPESERDFYTISRTAFRRQLQHLAVAQLVPTEISVLPTTPVVASPRCFLSFDDGTIDHFEIAFPVLTELRMRAVFFVPTIKLDRAGFLTRGHLRELVAAGHTIGCHSHRHERMDRLNAGEAAEQIKISTEILQEATGVKPWIFAPPGGLTNPHVLRAAATAGLTVIRTMRWGFNRKPDLLALETIPLTRHTTDRQFQKILHGEFSPLQYAGKEAIKSLLPTRAYEIFRGAVFRLTKRN